MGKTAFHRMGCRDFSAVEGGPESRFDMLFYLVPECHIDVLLPDVDRSEENEKGAGLWLLYPDFASLVRAFRQLLVYWLNLRH